MRAAAVELPAASSLQAVAVWTVAVPIRRTSAYGCEASYMRRSRGTPQRWLPPRPGSTQTTCSSPRSRRAARRSNRCRASPARRKRHSVRPSRQPRCRSDWSSPRASRSRAVAARPSRHRAGEPAKKIRLRRLCIRVQLLRGAERCGIVAEHRLQRRRHRYCAVGETGEVLVCHKQSARPRRQATRRRQAQRPRAGPA